MAGIGAAIALIAGRLALTHGFIVEWRQARATGPIARVATLPFGVQSALLITMGLVLLGRGHTWASLTWWGYLLVLLVSASFALGIISAAGRRR